MSAKPVTHGSTLSTGRIPISMSSFNQTDSPEFNLAAWVSPMFSNTVASYSSRFVCVYGLTSEVRAQLCFPIKPSFIDPHGTGVRRPLSYLCSTRRTEAFLSATRPSLRAAWLLKRILIIQRLSFGRDIPNRFYSSEISISPCMYPIRFS